MGILYHLSTKISNNLVGYSRENYSFHRALLTCKHVSREYLYIHRTFMEDKFKLQDEKFDKSLMISWSCTQICVHYSHWNVCSWCSFGKTGIICGFRTRKAYYETLKYSVGKNRMQKLFIYHLYAPNQILCSINWTLN